MTKREIAGSLLSKGYGLTTTTANERAEHDGARWNVYEILRDCVRDGSGCYIKLQGMEKLLNRVGAEHYFRTLDDVGQFIKTLER